MRALIIGKNGHCAARLRDGKRPLGFDISVFLGFKEVGFIDDIVAFGQDGFGIPIADDMGVDQIPGSKGRFQRNERRVIIQGAAHIPNDGERFEL